MAGAKKRPPRWRPCRSDAGYWPFWQLRVLLFYAVTLAGWIASPDNPLTPRDAGYWLFSTM